MKYKIVLLIILSFLLTGCHNTNQYSRELNVLNWSSYIPDDVITDFEKEYNIKVNYGTYSSNEELLAKLSSSKPGTYDLIFPSDYMVELMINKNLIQKIDKSKITNINLIDNRFLDKDYDKNNNYSLPFLTTGVVIAVNKDKVSEYIDDYDDLLNSNYKDSIVLIDDQRIIIGMALQALGYNMNETDTNKLEKAKEWLLKLKPNIKAYDSDSPKTFLITEEADMGVMWNAEAELAKEYNPDIAIVYPKSGHAISTDNYCIVKNAKNVDNAYLFIDYILRDDISKRIIEEYPYVSPNISLANKDNYKIQNIMTNGEYVQNIGGKISEYDKLWADIK